MGGSRRWWSAVGGLVMLLMAAPAAWAQPSPDKLALLVGVGDYPHAPRLQGPANDVVAMRDLLVARFGFPAHGVRVLRDEEATHDGILDAIREHLGRAAAGDVAVFYFSGHGSYRRDADGDEADGYDETLVPYDSGRGPHPARDITADELQEALAAVPSERLTVILDSCHSGTAPRGAGTSRGIPGNEQGGVRVVDGAARSIRPAPASYVLVSASGPQQRARERRYAGVAMGSLTFHLVRVLRAAPEGMTYRQVMDEVRAAVTADFGTQVPRVEGAGADAPLFGFPAPPRASTLGQRGLGDARAEESAGSIHGMTAGTELDVLDAGGGTVGRAVVDEVGPVASVARIEQGDVPSGALARARVRRRRYPPLRLAVAVDEDGPRAKRVARAIGRDPALELVTGASYRVRLRADEGGWHGEAASGEEILRPAAATKLGIERLRTDLRAWARWHQLLALRNDESELDVAFQVRPIQGTVSDGRLARSVTEGTALEVVIDNRSERELFFGVVDLTEAGRIHTILPRPGYDDPTVKAGATWRAEIVASVPDSWPRDSFMDHLRLIVSTVQTDFRALDQASVARAEQPPEDSLEALLRRWPSRKRGAETEFVDAVDWATRTVTVEVRRRADP